MLRDDYCGHCHHAKGGFVWPIFAPFVREEFTAPIQLVGLAVSGYFLLRMFSEFPIGVLSDRVDPKTPLIVGRLLAVVGAFICYRTTSIWITTDFTHSIA
ncbi:MAG: MFS transporter [Candidatus Bathyarchaeota archaeon]|nr:MFS transporter [Candidatus Bathyarchaeota archaeon]